MGAVDQGKRRGSFRPPAERLSVRWFCGTPPSDQRACCRFSAKAVKLSPPRTTPTCSQQAAMAVLLAEMQALSALLPVHGNPPTDPALIEAQFDNLPV